MLLQVLVMVLVLRGRGQQTGDVANAFGHTLPEQQLGTESQVLGVLYEAETDHGMLAGAQVLLQQTEGAWLPSKGKWRLTTGDKWVN